MASKGIDNRPQWMRDHEIEDNRRFTSIDEKLDSLLEIASAFRLGGQGVAWIVGILVGIGTIVVLIMQIFHK